MREYVVVLLTAGLVTYLATPVVRLAAVRLGMMAAPRERDVHVIPTPRGGGVAMYIGVSAAILVATRLPALQRTFDDSEIAALAFFAYSYHLGLVGYNDVASAPALITAVLAGACLGFLPHNFSPARIFMGDSGSMLVGLMLSAAAVSATGQTDSQTMGSAANLLPLTLPLLVPVAVLFIPFVDLLMAVIRRTRRGRSPFSPDKMHLHHRLLALGHSHRRAVLVMYFWAALLSFGAVALSITGGTVEVLVIVGALVGVGVVVVLSPRARREAIEARRAEL